MHIDTLRAWWAHRQGLDGSILGASAAEVLRRAGWARSVGGASPYLGFFARAGLSRADVDAAVAAVDVHELPSARGCTYVLPACDYAIGLRAGASAGMAETKVAAKLGVTETELVALEDAVLAALHGPPLAPDALRAAVGDAARSLGDEGKKKGVTTTLPVALGRLQVSGRIRRVPIGGRLDQQRYAYARWSPGPLDVDPPTEARALTELARRYFSWVGPATLAEYAAFAGVSGRVAREACAPLGLVAALDDRLVLPDDLDALRGFEAPSTPTPILVGSLDGLFAARRDVAGFVDDADRGWLTERALITLGALGDLPSHAIVDRGRLIGLWEFDVDEGRIAWATFGPADDAVREAVARTEVFVRDELQDARAFSLDTPKSRAPRIAALRAAAG